MLAFILSRATPGPALGPLSYREHRVALLHLTHWMSTTGGGVTFTINCSGFGQHGADPTALNSVFNRKPFRPVTNISVPTRVNISFTMSAILDVVSADLSSPPWCPEPFSSPWQGGLPKPLSTFLLPPPLLDGICLAWGSQRSSVQCSRVRYNSTWKRIFSSLSGCIPVTRF